MTVLDLVTDVLRQIGVISEADSPSAEEGQDAVTKLNNLMASLAEDGIDLGYNPKSTTADTIAIPDGHIGSIKAMLGMALADGYGVQPPVIMAAMADAGYKRLLRQALHAQMWQKVSDAPRGDRQRTAYNIVTDT